MLIEIGHVEAIFQYPVTSLGLWPRMSDVAARLPYPVGSYLWNPVTNSFWVWPLTLRVRTKTPSKVPVMGKASSASALPDMSVETDPTARQPEGPAPKRQNSTA